MGSSSRPLIPEAEPWQPIIKPPPQNHHYYLYYYPFLRYNPRTETQQTSILNVFNQPQQQQPRGGVTGTFVSYHLKKPTVSIPKMAPNGGFGSSQRKRKWVKKIHYSGGQLERPISMAGAGEKTTVMIRNIPNQFRRDMLLSFLDEYCIKFKLEYDFVYLPMDFESLDNLGYAFVNFTSASAAAKIQQVLTNYKWDLIPVAKGFIQSKKTCQVTWARLQGKNDLVNNFANTFFSCYTLDYLPIVLDPPRNGSNSNLTKSMPIGKCKELPLLAPTKLVN